MHETEENPQGKTYGKLLRELRLALHWTQREAAEASGIASSTWGNVEAYGHRVIAKPRLERALTALKATAAQRAEVLEAYDRAPTTPFAEKQREKWQRANAQRKAAGRAGVLEDALVDLLDMMCGEGALCYCTTEDVCALCQATRALELGEQFDAARVASAIEERFPDPVGNPVESVDSGSEVDAAAEFG